jgi:hypothetical protein
MKLVKPKALKSLYRSPGYKKKQLAQAALTAVYFQIKFLIRIFVFFLLIALR